MMPTPKIVIEYDAVDGTGDIFQEENSLGAMMETLLSFLMMPWSLLLRGYVIKKTWLWFVVTTFHAAPLSIPEALGVSMIVSVFTFDMTTQREKMKWYQAAIASLVLAGFQLGIGWIIHLFL